MGPRQLMSRLAAVAVAVALAAATPAAAVKTVAPPGNSGVDQYLETVPGAHGPHPTFGPRSSPGTRHALSAAAEARLARLGADGRATAAIANNGAPERTRAGAAPAPTSSSSGGAAPAISAAVSGSGGGMGWLLPVVLSASTLAAIAFSLTRRRA